MPMQMCTLRSSWPVLKTSVVSAPQKIKVAERSAMLIKWLLWTPKAWWTASKAVKMNQHHLIVIYFSFWTELCSNKNSFIPSAEQSSELNEVQDNCLLQCYSDSDDTDSDEFMACAQNICNVTTPDNEGCGKKCFFFYMTVMDPTGLGECFQRCEDEPTPSDCMVSLFIFFFWELSISYIYIYDSLILLAAQLSEIDEIQEQCVLECYNNYDDAYADEYVEEFMVCAQNSCDVSIPDNIGCRNTCYSDHMPAWDVRGLVNCFQSCEE